MKVTVKYCKKYLIIIGDKMNIYIKNAFINNMYNLKGSPASVELVENIDDIEYMLYQTKKLKLPISVFLKKQILKINLK